MVLNITAAKHMPENHLVGGFQIRAVAQAV